MTQVTIQPLLAADAWSTIIGLIIFMAWSALQWLSTRNEAQQHQKPRRPRPPQPVDGAERLSPQQLPPGPKQRLPQAKPQRGQIPQRPNPQHQGPQRQVPVGPAPRNQADALRSEVEEFLRRAQGGAAPTKDVQPPIESGPQQRTARSPAPRPAEPRTLVDEVERGESRRRPRPAQQAALESHNVREQGLRKQGIAEHVAAHLSTREFAERSAALGEAVGSADERLESRLHEKFDHDLGSLKHRDTPLPTPSQATKSSPTDIAAEIATMLREPAGMRQLIVANEILRRPEW